jgi:hypothetical protein
VVLRLDGTYFDYELALDVARMVIAEFKSAGLALAWEPEDVVVDSGLVVDQSEDLLTEQKHRRREKADVEKARRLLGLPPIQARVPPQFPAESEEAR